MKEHKSKVPGRRFFRYGRTRPAERKTANRAGVETPVLLVGLFIMPPVRAGLAGAAYCRGRWARSRARRMARHRGGAAAMAMMPLKREAGTFAARVSRAISGCSPSTSRPL